VAEYDAEIIDMPAMEDKPRRVLRFYAEFKLGVGLSKLNSTSTELYCILL